eukprot:TRINITY_DN13825_c1_g3_i1.p1 TRINITY_DN13825_c1_g3~~TRINITY_DN13825_c1_g3_i1.p1  ORF type:complete len:334 (+),score=39.64 TRINITY_DN13825_c1_g3_i1:77-1078(+)
MGASQSGGRRAGCQRNAGRASGQRAPAARPAGAAAGGARPPRGAGAQALGRAVGRGAARCRRLLPGRRAAQGAEERAPLLRMPDPAPAAGGGLGGSPETMHVSARSEDAGVRLSGPESGGLRERDEPAAQWVPSARTCPTSRLCPVRREQSGLAELLERRALRRQCKGRFACWLRLVRLRRRGRGPLTELRHRGPEETMQFVLNIDNIGHRVAAFVAPSYAPVCWGAALQSANIATRRTDAWGSVSRRLGDTRRHVNWYAAELRYFYTRLQTVLRPNDYMQPDWRRFIRRMRMQLQILAIYQHQLEDLEDEANEARLRLMRTCNSLRCPLSQP